MAGPNPLEQLEQLGLLLVREVPDGDLVRLPHLLVELVEYGEATLGDVAEHLPPVR